MNVKIIATKACSHRPNMEKELQDLGIGYEVIFVEDRPDIVQLFDIRHSPNLIVDGQIVCRKQPTKSELRDLLHLK